jgi:hypothetical protein
MLVRASLLGLLFLAACGNLTTIPDHKLAAIPYDKKESMRLAKEEMDVATAVLEQAEGKGASEESKSFAEIARKEIDLAKAKVEVAKAQKDGAEVSGKTAEITIAKQSLSLAELELEVANAKVEYADSTIAFAEIEKPYAKAKQKAAAANYELAKIRLLEANGLSKDFDSEKIKSQASKYQERLKAEEGNAGDLLKRRDSSKTRYEQLQAKLEAARAGNPEAGKTPTSPGAEPGTLNPAPTSQP